MSPKEPITINFTEYSRTTKQLGSNLGGFFRHNQTKKEYYIKWLPASFSDEEKRKFYKEKFFKGEELNSANKDKLKDRHRNRFNNEVLAIRLYELYGVAVPKVTFISFNSENELCYGVMSEKIPTLVSIKNKLNQSLVKFKIQEDFLIDVLLSNYDVVGSWFDNIFFDTATKAPCRLVAGGGFKYLAKAAAKKYRSPLDTDLPEFKDMLSGGLKQRKFNPTALKSAGELFKGIETSPVLCRSLRKLLLVPYQQYEDCIRENGFIGGEDKDKRKNAQFIGIFVFRLCAIINKALALIVKQLNNLQRHRSLFLKYLGDAGIDKDSQDKIVRFWGQEDTNKKISF